MIFPAPYLARRLLPLVILFLFCGPAGAEDLFGRVEWIYDGDTIKVVNIGKVRLIGIDAPERESSPKDAYYMRQGISRKTLRSVASRATRFNIRHAKNRIVRLEPNRRERDDYGRLLAFVYLPDGSLLNRLLVEKGLAAVYRRFDFPYRESFLEAEQKAREEGKGLWKNATASP
jgi:micrococcal nuclease